MGKEAVFLRIIHDEIRREIPVVLLAVDPHLPCWQRSLQPIGDSFVIGTEDDGIFARHAEMQLFVVLANLRKFLADCRLDYLIGGALLQINHLGLRTQLFVVDVERKRAVLKQSSAT